MKTLRLLSLVLSLCLFAACTASNNGKSESDKAADSLDSPGVGAAQDNSKAVGDSLTQEADTTSLKKP